MTTNDAPRPPATIREEAQARGLALNGSKTVFNGVIYWHAQNHTALGFDYKAGRYVVRRV